MPPFDAFSTFDALLIAPFRLLKDPEAGFVLGVILLALGSAVLGRLSADLAGRSHRHRHGREEGAAKHHSELSLAALRQKDKAAYLAQNHLAQEAYGHVMALSATRGAALLWPGMLALAWLCWRFADAPMPWLWQSAGPAAWFLPPYAASLWALGRLNGKSPTDA